MRDSDALKSATDIYFLFSAHISFHYYKGDTADQKERLRHALCSIAWPMLQAGSSTILSLLVLATIHAYMVQVFVKVVVLVVGLGMIHGLLVLPIVYAALPFKKFNEDSSSTNKVAPIVFSVTAKKHDIEINASNADVSANKEESNPRPESNRG